MRVAAAEARENLPALLRDAAGGAAIVVERHGRPVAGIVPPGVAEALLSGKGVEPLSRVPLSKIERELRRAGTAVKGVEKLVIFGSYARGDAGPRSDIDVMLVVRKGHPWTTVYLALSRVLRATRLRFDIVPVLSAFWAKTDFGVVASAKLEGRVVYERR